MTRGVAVKVDLTRARWRKSSRSQNGGNCVEVAECAEAIAVRDSRDVAGPVLIVAPSTWQAFMRTIQRDEL